MPKETEPLTLTKKPISKLRMASLFFLLVFLTAIPFTSLIKTDEDLNVAAKYKSCVSHLTETCKDTEIRLATKNYFINKFYKGVANSTAMISLILSWLMFKIHWVRFKGKERYP